MLRPPGWPCGHTLKIGDLSLQLSADSSIPCWCRHLRMLLRFYEFQTSSLSPGISLRRFWRKRLLGSSPVCWGFMWFPGYETLNELEWVLKSACMRCSPRHVTPPVPVIQNSWNCSYIRNSHSCMDHCRWSAIISPSSWIKTSTYVPKHLNCFHNAWMPSILVPDKQQKSGKLKPRKWNVKSYAHLDGVHDDLETLNCKTWSFPKTVSVQVPETHTNLFNTQRSCGTDHYGRAKYIINHSFKTYWEG